RQRGRNCSPRQKGYRRDCPRRWCLATIAIHRVRADAPIQQIVTGVTIQLVVAREGIERFVVAKAILTFTGGRLALMLHGRRLQPRLAYQRLLGKLNTAPSRTPAEGQRCVMVL